MSVALALIEKVARAPKAELHVHIEGTLEPETIFRLAQRNGVVLNYPTVESLRQAYEFHDLQSFLDIYYAGTSVLLTEQDFYEMTVEYLDNARANGVIHTEMFFDPQSHTARGVGFEIFMPGVLRAMKQGEANGISSRLIICFLRHLPEASALETFEQARGWFTRYPEQIIGVGLDSSEQGHPPSKFTRVFALAQQAGLRLVAHAGEEGPVDYIAEALDILKVERIDHGVRNLESDQMIARLRDSRMPLTVCPLSNIKLAVFDDMRQHNLLALLNAGVNVTINSDDPAYFGGHVNENYAALITALDLNEQQCYRLLRNSLESTFASAELRQSMVTRLDQYWARH
ncbi:adenosine deaminase [Shimwellia pseudoproteus]|uniref:adenosine deaminase n=1 Tax=Shimwellia pseudoproteus TaxID=570012 RepID=UPI0018EC806C|nr:adenosine deaminase [Shimwellia pseudoproteus]MBJ3816135.1 adenosine deaminase [Shimwellia pseudoproteus]